MTWCLASISMVFSFYFHHFQEENLLLITRPSRSNAPPALRFPAGEHGWQPAVAAIHGRSVKASLKEHRSLLLVWKKAENVFLRMYITHRISKKQTLLPHRSQLIYIFQEKKGKKIVLGLHLCDPLFSGRQSGLWRLWVTTSIDVRTQNPETHSLNYPIFTFLMRLFTFSLKYPKCWFFTFLMKMLIVLHQRS